MTEILVQSSAATIPQKMVLRVLRELEEEWVDPRKATIAGRIGSSLALTRDTLARMERYGLVRQLPDRSIELTAEGRAQAITIMRKHRVVECFLADVVELDRHLVHGEASRWQNVLGDDTEYRMLRLLGFPTTSPFGNLIPGVEAFRSAMCGSPWAEEPLLSRLGDLGVRLGDAVGFAGGVTVLWISERLQADHAQLCVLDSLGIGPGTELIVREVSGGGRDVRVEVHGVEQMIDSAAADGVWVARF